jgi:tartrate dehydrogenase/decarboxylase/D-malate dehydrogenase
MAKNRFNIAVIAGDGIGTEVMPEGLRALSAAAAKFDINLHFDHFDLDWYFFL